MCRLVTKVDTCAVDEPNTTRLAAPDSLSSALSCDDRLNYSPRTLESGHRVEKWRYSNNINININRRHACVVFVHDVYKPRGDSCMIALLVVSAWVGCFATTLNDACMQNGFSLYNAQPVVF